jgi:hypothetical protein
MAMMAFMRYITGVLVAIEAVNSVVTVVEVVAEAVSEAVGVNVETSVAGVEADVADLEVVGEIKPISPRSIVRFVG